MDKATLLQLSLGFLFGAVIAFSAWRVQALSRSGAWAAAISGGLIFGLGGWTWTALLLTFFISSSLLSRAFSHRKKAMVDKFSKGSQRDWGQVLANGGLGTALVLVHAWRPDQPWPWLAYAGAMAAVNADTWATEIGVLSKWPPRLITSGQLVERGASGGVSLSGSLAAFTGAALIAFITALASAQTWAIIAAVILGGLLGSFFDSFLGATVQSIYVCPLCEKETERHPLHTCGTPTLHVRGWRWLNNDWVNFACSLVGALASVGTWFLLLRAMLQGG
jgi:uncharacterized protein (TIGR00297 family)